MIDSHKQVDMIEVLSQQPLEVRQKVEEVRVDMWGGFPKFVAKVFPNAQIVFDRFHVMKPVNEELNKVRQQVNMTLKGSKFILLKNAVDLTSEERIKLDGILSHSPRLRLTYELKEEFRTIFERRQTVEQGKEQLLEWLKKARPVYSDVLATIRNHFAGQTHTFLHIFEEGIDAWDKILSR